MSRAARGELGLPRGALEITKRRRNNLFALDSRTGALFLTSQRLQGRTPPNIAGHRQQPQIPQF